MHFQTSKSIFCLALLIVLSGCASAHKHHLSAIAMFDRGEASAAVTELEKASKLRGGEEEIIVVDQAIAKLMAGEAKSCEQELNKVRKQIDFLRQKDVREQATAVISDDHAVAWSGREFEQRMIDNLLVLTSLVGDRQDAFAYASQGMEHASVDRQLIQSSSANASNVVTVGHVAAAQPPAVVPDRFRPNALTAYLSASVHSEIPLNANITDKAIADVQYWNSFAGDRIRQNNAGRSPIMTGFGVNSNAGHGVVHVVTLVGRATDWTAETAAPTSAALLIADQIISAVGEHTLPPTIAPVKIARPVDEQSMDPFVTSVTIAGQEASPPVFSVPLLDINQAAWDSYQADRDKQIARAVARRIVKKASVYAAKDHLSVSNDSGVDLLMNLGGIAWEAMEKPDTRHINLLPERIDVLQVELPDGVHTLNLNASLPGTAPRSATSQTTVSVENGKNTFIVCFRTGDRITSVISR